MPHTKHRRKEDALSLRVDPALKAEFMAATESENKPVAEVLRNFMRSYVQRAKRKRFTKLPCCASPFSRERKQDFTRSLRSWLTRSPPCPGPKLASVLVLWRRAPCAPLIRPSKDFWTWNKKTIALLLRLKPVLPPRNSSRDYAAEILGRLTGVIAANSFCRRFLTW